MNVTKTLTIKSTITGAQETAAGLNNIAGAQEGVAVASDKANKATLSSEAVLERLRRQLDTTYRSQKQFEQATRDLDKVQAQGKISSDQYWQLLDMAQKRLQAASRTTDTFGNSLNSLQGRLDNTFRAQQEFARATQFLDQAAAKGTITQSRYFELLQLAHQRYRNVINSQNAFGKSIGLSTGAMQNMSFQLNDIVSGLAMGQSPFQIMVQQGGQVLQILQMHEGGIRGSLRAMKDALLALPTPIKALGLGFAAAGVAATAFWMIFRNSAPTAEAALEEHDRLVKVMAQSYATAAGEADKFFKQGKDQTIFEMMRNGAAMMANLQTMIQSAQRLTNRPVESVPGEMGSLAPEQMMSSQLLERFSAFRSQIEALNESIRKGAPDYKTFNKEVSQIGIANPALGALAAELLAGNKAASEMALAIEVNSANIAVLSGTATEAQKALSTLAGAMRAITGAAVADPFKKYTDAIKEMEQLGGEKGFPGLKLRTELQKNNEAFNRGRDALREGSLSVEDYNAKLTALTDKHQLAAAGIRANNAAQAQGADSVTMLIQRTRDRIDELDLEAKTAGRTADAVLKLKLQHDAERAAMSRGKGLTDAEQRELDILKEQLAVRTRIARQKQIDLKFEEQMQNALFEGIGSFLNDLAKGVTLSEALAKNLSSMADSFIKAGSQQISKSLQTSFGDMLGGGLMGGIGGGLAGIGIGVAIQGLSELFKDNAEEQKKVADATKKFNDELDKLSDTINGKVIGSIQSQVQAFTDQANAIAEEAQQAAQQAADQSTGFFEGLFDDWFGMDPDPVVDFKSQAKYQKTLDDINKFLAEATETFRNNFETSIRSLTAGMGFSAVAQEITDFGKKLQEFIADTRTAFGADAGGNAAAQRAVDASIAMTLSFITGEKAMTDLEKEMLRIEEAAEAATNVLIDLGLSADQAADAVARSAAAARDAAQAAEEQRIATEAMSLQLRILRATTDTSTQEGALAVFDLQAALELAQARADPLQAANLPLLEQAIAAERMAIINDFNRQAIEAERRAAEERQRILEEAQRELEQFAINIGKFISGLTTGSQSPLSPQARLAQAQADFAAQLQIIQTGSPSEIRAAMGSITQFAQQVLDANRDFNASSEAGQEIFQDVVDSLEALPAQISVQELILEATEDQTAVIIDTLTQLQTIRNELNTNFDAIDTNTDGLITFDEMQAALGATYNSGTLRSIFTELDGNGNGVLEKEEAIKNATTSTAASTASTANDIAIGVLNRLTEVNTNLTTTVTNILGAINNNLRAQSQAWPLGFNGGQFFPPLSLFHQGGLVQEGMNTPLRMSRGTASSGEMLARLLPGEFVMQPRAVQALGVGTMEALNMSTANDNLVQEVRSLRNEVRRLVRIAASGHQATVEAVSVGNGAMRDMAKRQRLAVARG